MNLQGAKRSFDTHHALNGLSFIEKSFPNHSFPTGAIHECSSKTPEDAAATNGFIAAMLSKLLIQKGTCLWIAAKQTIFPPALKLFGIRPDQIVFVSLYRPKDLIWGIEEALKCNALTAVIGELRDLTFTESQRLQLAVEKSKVTGFIHRCTPRMESALACAARWKITAAASTKEQGMPGVGFPAWNVQLHKVRNGKPGSWLVQWMDGQFQPVIHTPVAIPEIKKRKAG